MAAAAAKAAAATPPAENSLVCQKCLEPTLLKDSIANGRNCLRRNCLDCVSTDKWLCRCLKKPKSTETESEAAKERRNKAEALKASLSKMSPTEKAQWYCKQKEERRRQEKGTKRTFSTGVGFVQEELTTSLGTADKDIFETCEDWCARQLMLQKYSSLEQAEQAFRQECSKPGAKTMQKRGQTLLGRFVGVEVDMTHRHGLTQGVRQRADLHNQEDLEAFQAESKDRMDKGQWRLESDRQACLENTLKAPTELLNVQGDIEKFQQQEAELEQAWMEQLETEAKAKPSAPKAAMPKSAGVEAMGYQAAISRTIQSMQDILTRQQALLLGAQEETNLLDTQLLRNEGAAKQKECEDLIPELQVSIEDMEKKWSEDKKKHEASGDADKLHEGIAQVAKDFKEWSTKHDALHRFKNLVKDFKAWLAKSKAAAKKTEKANAQAKAALQSSNVGHASSWSDLALCRQSLQDVTDLTAENRFQDKGLAWNFARDLMEKEDTQTIAPVVFSSAQGQPFAEEMKAHDYFRFQKLWVGEQMKRANACWLSGLVTKNTVARKLLATWSKLLGAECEKFSSKLPADLAEQFQPQFFQQKEKSCSVHLHADFGLPDVRLCLEGNFFYMGFPLSKLQGTDLSTQREDLTRQSWQSFQRLCTWSCKTGPGKVIAIPGDHVFCSFALEESHGARIHALCGNHVARTIQMTQSLLKDNPLLSSMKTGRLSKALETSMAKPKKPLAADGDSANSAPPAKKTKTEKKKENP